MTNDSSNPPQIPRRGFCLILSSPSGAGKTTLAKRLVSSGLNIALSISVTTRPRRASEVDGIDYIFVKPEQFAEIKDANGFLEWAEVFGNFYGTPAARVEQAQIRGHDLVFDLDWQGAEAIAKLLPRDAVRVFILPPSRDELVRRIYGRGTDAAEVIKARLDGADDEMSHWRDYDYIIVNEDVETSLAGLIAIVTAERFRRERSDLGSFVDTLMARGQQSVLISENAAEAPPTARNHPR